MRGRTVEQRWKRHLIAAAASGQSLAAYAREHGLNRKTLYSARKRLQELEATGKGSALSRARSAPAGKAFVPVQVKALEPSAALPGTLRARLPNGILIECEGAGLAVSFERWLFSLMVLPCSGSTRS